MVMMQGRVSAEYDSAADTLLMSAFAGIAGAETDQSLDGVSVHALTGAFWDNNEVPMGWFAVNIHLTTFSTTGDILKINLYGKGASGSDVDKGDTLLGSLTLAYDTLGTVKTGFYRFAVDAKTAALLCPGLTYIAAAVDLSAGGASVCSAWLSFLKAS